MVEKLLKGGTMRRIKKEKEFVYSEKVIHRGKILDLLTKKRITQSQPLRK